MIQLEINNIYKNFGGLQVLADVSFPQILEEAHGWPGLLVFVLLGWVLVKIPLSQIRSKT